MVVAMRNFKVMFHKFTYSALVPVIIVHKVGYLD
jgi:hypothetical protein